MSKTSSTLASLEAKRDSKRRQVEALFEQQQAIQRQMAALQVELQALDDEIDAFEAEDESSPSRRVSDDNDTDEQLMIQQHYADEILTEQPIPNTMTQHPDEILTEPTQVEDEEFPAAAAAAAANSMAGQLQLTTTMPSRTTKRAHAATPQGLQQTGALASKKKTIEDFWASKPSSLPSAAAAAASAARNESSYARPNGIAAAHANDGGRDRSASLNRRAHVFPWTTQVHDLLLKTFRIPSFRGHQEEIINATLSQEDVFVIMRTGGGKSLTYQLPALLEANKITVVVSPLLSLIRDQEEQMNQFRPNSAVSFCSNIGTQEHGRRWSMVRDPQSGICLVLVTPEKIHKSNKLKNELEKLYNAGRLGRFVIDECHCCSNWGHDFRPDYTKLGLLKTHFPSIPVLAVTATASDRVRDDVCNILRLGPNYRFFRSTAKRPNLSYSVRLKIPKDVVDDMAEFIKQHHVNSAGIIYTFSRKEADAVAGKLCDLGIVARSYHSSVSDSQKEHIHQSWMRNETQVIVATIAFGLGINKPDVSFVLHHTLSKSLEAYYQESGRAGRDGRPADCVLWYSAKDVPRMIGMIHGESGEHTFWSMVRYAQASGNDDVCKAIILKSLGEPNCPDVDQVLAANDGVTTKERDVGAHAKTLTELLRYKIVRGEDLTLNSLVKEWRSKNAPECVQNNPPGKELTVDDCERIIVCLLLENVISPNVVWNAYSTTMYLKLGAKAELLLGSQDPKVYVRLPVKPAKAIPKSTTAKKSKKATTDQDGWIQSKKKSKPTSAKRKSQPKKPKASKKTKATPKEEVIELLNESSDDEEPIINAAGKISWEDDDDYDIGSDGEYELE